MPQERQTDIGPRRSASSRLSGATALLAGILAFCPLLCGWTESWETIRKASASVTTVSSGFTQKKHLPILARPLVSKGRFAFQSPRDLRWEYASPVRSILLMHDGAVKRYTLSGKAWVPDASERLQALAVILQEMAHWTTGRFDQNPYFAADLKTEGGVRVIVLTPREKALAEMISRIEITPDPGRPGAFRTIKMVEGPQAYTLLEFSDVQINRPLDPALFRNRE